MGAMVNGSAFMGQAVYRHMKDNNADKMCSIVNISSISAHQVRGQSYSNR